MHVGHKVRDVLVVITEASVMWAELHVLQPAFSPQSTPYSLAFLTPSKQLGSGTCGRQRCQ